MCQLSGKFIIFAILEIKLNNDMEFIVSSAALLKGIMDVSKAIPAKTTLPILENFLFELTGDKLTLTASDQELTLRTVVPVDSTAKEGSIAVPARQLTELLKALPDQPLTIKSAGDSTFECIWNNGNSSLPYFPAADYPAIKGAEDDATEVTFPATELIDGISGTVYATADDEMRPAMNGIYFDMEPASTTLVASDAHKLICYTTTEAKVADKASFILHKKPAGVLKSILDKDAEVTVRFDSKTVQFNFGETMMICRLVVGKYPQYRSVIPKDNPNILKIDRQQLLNTVRRVSVCANKSSNHIKLDLRPGQLEVTAQDLGFALAAYEKLECDYNGGELSIGFKSSFLIEILSNMGCESLVLKFSDSKHSVLILPSEEEAAKEKVCGILMPIMVS
jgi:DNA polymerase-3 subunit beta